MRYLLLEMCELHRDSKHILIPLEIVVDIVLYNGPFLAILLRLLYLSWKVAYDEAVLTGAIYENESSSTHNPAFSISSIFFSDTSSSHYSRHHSSSNSRPGVGGYVGLAMEDLDDIEQGRSRATARGENGRSSSGVVNSSTMYKKQSGDSVDKRGGIGNSNSNPPSYESRDHSPKVLSPKVSLKTSRGSTRMSPRTSPKISSPLRNVVIFNMESSDEEDHDNADGQRQQR